MNEQQFLEVTQWQKETFPEATPLSKLHHLKEEIDELTHAVFFEYSVDATRLEFADCFLLLFGAAKAYGMSYADIEKCVNDKLAICRKRKWGKPDKNGVVKHINL
jgi:NTP pyrophosphatase (non-canonical NTP hydrolase)